MKRLRFLVLGCVCAMGCTGNGEVEQREIPAERPSGASSADSPAGGGGGSGMSNSAATDAPVE